MNMAQHTVRSLQGLNPTQKKSQATNKSGNRRDEKGTSTGCSVPNSAQKIHTGAIYGPKRLYLGNVHLGIRYEEQENCS